MKNHKKATKNHEKIVIFLIFLQIFAFLTKSNTTNILKLNLFLYFNKTNFIAYYFS